MLNRAWMEVDLGAMRRNASVLAARSGAPIIPMVKADAYGLGAIEVVGALEELKPLAYGVATVEEGAELRRAGITRPIVIFTPLLAEEFEAAHGHELTPTLGTREAIAAWGLYGSQYYLSIDTGMARAGAPWRTVSELSDLVARQPPFAAFTHFHSAQLDDGSMDEQLQRFETAVGALPARPMLLHTDSSAAVVRRDGSGFDAVRPGIFMYGVGSGKVAAVQPEPVVSLMARIVETRFVEAGDTVSYDATWTALEPSVIATIPLGYADGYPRGASNVGTAIVREKTVRIAGRVTMDMIMLDVTGAGAEVGDVVTMIGESKSGFSIDVASVAEAASMSPYELLTGLNSRLERIYRDGE